MATNDRPLEADELAQKYGPARSEGGSVTITVTQWRRILHDLAIERRRTAALIRVGSRVLDGLARLESYIASDDTRAILHRIAGDLRQAVTVIEESRGDDV